MARTRNLKPGFFNNEILAECEPLARIAFEGLWCWADREGRLEYRPRRLKVNILPYDDCDFDALVGQLAERGFVRVYEVDGGRYLQVSNFDKHQNPHQKEAASTLPEPPPQGAENVEEPASTGKAPDKPGADNDQGNDKPGLNLSSLTLNHELEEDAVSQPQPSRGKGRKKQRKVYPEAFEHFWKVWLSVKGGGDKSPAFDAWDKLSADLQIDAHRLAMPWFKDWRARNPDASVIHASTYLNDQRFDGFDPSRAVAATGPPDTGYVSLAEQQRNQRPPSKDLNEWQPETKFLTGS